MWKILDTFERGIVKFRRKRLAREIFRVHNGTVQRGVFSGMRMTGDANVSQGAHALKIFGLYETPVIDTLLDWCPAKLMINIGAGDGYYAIGMRHAKLVEHSVCFEATQSGRVAIAKNAKINKVSADISLHGVANSETIVQVLEELNVEPSETIVLCDIEGGEFDLFDENVLQLLRGAKILVELHETSQRPLLAKNMFDRFKKHYSTAIVSDRARRWEGIPELEELHGIDRAIVTSEARKGLGEWLVAAPTAASLSAKLRIKRAG